jgi:pantothenate kinase
MKIHSDYFAEEIEDVQCFREKLNWKSVNDVDKFLVKLMQYLKDAEMTIKNYEEGNNENN